jgi:hypothetical protein
MNMEGKPVRRLAALALAGLLMGTACGGRPDVFAGDARQNRAAGFNDLELPDLVPAVPAFVVESKKPFSDAELKALSSLEGAALVVPASVQTISVSTPKNKTRLDVAAVDPIDFRSVAPASTRSADFVWFALIGGDAVMTQDAAKKLKLGSETQISAKGLGKLRVGALADNATPNFADLLISSESAHRFGAPQHAIIGAKSGVTLNDMARRVRAEVGNASVSWLLPKSQSVVTQQAALAAGSIPSVAGLHPALSAAVNQLIAASKGQVWIVSGYRDSLRQYQLWVQALEKYGDPEIADNWVAPPGRSYHERGLAVDLGGNLELAAGLVQQMRLPMWRPMNWEPWHFELAGSRG